jgi:hypothetical protein
MVGLLGCGCCNGGGGGDPPPLCLSTNKTQFSDDFYPTFDPGWLTISMQLLAVNGTARCNGQSFFGFPWTRGTAYAQMQKQTLAGKIEASVTLVSWPTTPPPYLTPAYRSKLVVVFNGYGRYEVSAYRDHFVNVYRVTTNDGGTSGGPLIWAQFGSPRAGDTFGYRLTNFVSQLPFVNEVICQKLEVLINGSVAWTSPSPPLWVYPRLAPCEFICGLEIEQAFFPQFPMFAGQIVLQLDDYQIICE